MKKIIIPKVEDKNTIDLGLICEHAPIFAKESGVLFGMVVLEKDGWIVRCGKDNGAYGWHDSLRKLLEEGEGMGYEFFVV